MNRRSLLRTLAASTAAAWGTGVLAQATRARAGEPLPSSSKKPAAIRKNPIAVSTYSFWQFNGPNTNAPVDRCIDRAAEMGFDGVEILERQLHTKDPAFLRGLKRQALTRGLALCGLSTHQSFLFPEAEKRKKNVEITLASIELAYTLGIPTVRVNTGSWGTRGNFDNLMKFRGIEEPLPGHTDEEAFGWVAAALEECLKAAERAGVVLGLENHWGLARTPEGLLRIVSAVDSPWLGVTMDTGNFLDDPYDKLQKIASKTTYVHAKTYYGGGIWYALDLDYRRIADILRRAAYRGFVSLEFEGREDPGTAVPKSLALLREAFSTEG